MLLIEDTFFIRIGNTVVVVIVEGCLCRGGKYIDKHARDGMFSDVLLNVLGREDCTGMYENRAIRPRPGINWINDGLATFISLAAEIIEPLTRRQVDCAACLPFTQDRRGKQLIAKHPFVGNVHRSACVCRKIPEEWANNTDARLVGLAFVGVHIRNEAVSQFDRGLSVGLGLSAENPWLAMLIQAPVYAHDWNQCRELDPARVVFGIGVSLEAPSVHAPMRFTEIDR